MKRCFEIRGCPASHYLNCVAYRNGLNCWETPQIPCCKRNDKERCPQCPIYQTVVGKSEKTKLTE
ncbi:MAG: hypothetical protein QME42_06590 [bacterium]|nr:hypothetical protein [bacterium]